MKGRELSSARVDHEFTFRMCIAALSTPKSLLRLYCVRASSSRPPNDENRLREYCQFYGTSPIGGGR